MAIKRISPEDWERLLPALSTCTMATVNIARAVLVEGRKQVEVAATYKKSKQTVNGAIRRVTEIFEESVPKDDQMELVSVWLPKEQAAQVRKMAAAYTKNNGK